MSNSLRNPLTMRLEREIEELRTKMDTAESRLAEAEAERDRMREALETAGCRNARGYRPCTSSPEFVRADYCWVCAALSPSPTKAAQPDAKEGADMPRHGFVDPQVVGRTNCAACGRSRREHHDPGTPGEDPR